MESCLLGSTKVRLITAGLCLTAMLTLTALDTAISKLNGLQLQTWLTELPPCGYTTPGLRT